MSGTSPRLRDDPSPEMLALMAMLTQDWKKLVQRWVEEQILGIRFRRNYIVRATGLIARQCGFQKQLLVRIVDSRRLEIFAELLPGRIAVDPGVGIYVSHPFRTQSVPFTVRNGIAVASLDVSPRSLPRRMSLGLTRTDGSHWLREQDQSLIHLLVYTGVWLWTGFAITRRFLHLGHH